VCFEQEQVEQVDYYFVGQHVSGQIQPDKVSQIEIVWLFRITSNGLNHNFRVLLRQ